MSDHTNPPDDVLVELSGDEMEQVQGGEMESDDLTVSDDEAASSGYIRVKKLHTGG